MASRISRTKIVAAAFDLLDERGIDGLTVRALAERLGVRAPALYWHVTSKQELLDEMGTEIQRRVFAALAATPPADDLNEALLTYARQLRSEYLSHRDGARTFAGTRLTDPAVLRAQEPWLAAWASTGGELADAVRGAELVTSFVVGFVIEEQERRQSGEERYSLQARSEQVGAAAPNVVASGELLFADPQARFDDHLETIIAGLRARQATPPAS